MCTTHRELPSTVGSGIAWTRTDNLQTMGRILHCTQSAFTRRTLDNQQGVKQITLEEALNREDIQAAIICTENVSHEEYIRKFLDAGKHVCVEYPMSLSVAVARELWELADKKVTQRFLQFHLTKMQPKQSEQDKLWPLTWIEERAPGLGRVKNINFRFDSGTLDHIPNAPKEPVGIFMQDLNWFGEKLLGQVLSEQLQAERRRILHCLELADRIKELCQKSAQNNL
ncbi:UNVERIFIED_CONTAM: hypothetical protein FKN15_052286 [Acipenser sinensis]